MATSFTGSLGQTNNYSSVTDLITQWPTAAQNQGIQLSGIAFDEVETNYTNPTAISNLTLAPNETPKSGLSYGAAAGIGVPASYSGWFTDATKIRAEINYDPNTNESQVLKVKWADNQEITSATIGISALLPISATGDQGNEAGVVRLFKDGAPVSASNFTITRLNPPNPQKPITVSSNRVTFTGDSITGDLTFQIVGDSLTGLTFDELQFSAKAYDSPTAAYLTTAFKDDSSDYLVRNIQYQGITVVPTSPSLFQFAQPNYTVAEGGVATINVIRTGNTAAASINYATLDGSASSAGSTPDYTSAAGLLNFAAGQTTASFTVTALTDAILESAETVSLVLLGGNVGSNPSFLTINDVVSTTPTPTPTPTSTSLFQFAQPNYTVAEGGAATINVTRTGGTEAASINYQTLDGSASSAGTAPDYASAAGVLNFAAGQTTASFTVPALTDAILESAETVSLVLFGGNVSSPSILTINDVVSTTPTPTPTPTSTSLFQFAQPNYTVAEGGAATINVIRTGGTEAASINYQTLDGSASSAGSAPDYNSAAGVLNFAAGQTTASFTVPALTDAISESAETVNLVLFGGNVSNPSLLTINDVVSTTVAPTPTPTSTSLFQFAQPNYTVAEGGAATINVTRTGGTEAASINYQTLDGSASSAGSTADYNSAAGVLNFGAGQTTASFTVTALTDAILESPETVNLVLLGGNVGSTPSILTINDVVSTTVAPTPTPTSPSLFQFAQPNYTVAEGSVATINVTRTGGTQAASINYQTLDGSASSAGSTADYNSAAGVLNFGAGQTTASFTVTALTDSILESSPETVNLVLLGGNVGSTPSILTISDVPPAAGTTPAPTPTPATSTATQFVFSAATFTTAESSGFATVTVNRIGSTTAAASIGYATLDGTALSTGTAVDYASDAGVLNFGPGVTSTTFTLFVKADTVPEMTETVSLYLNSGPVGSPSTAILQIIDGSGGSASGNVFQYSASNYGSIAMQGGSTTVTVTRSSGLGAASIDYIILPATPGGTGPAPVYGTDYLLNPGSPTGGTLSFASGQLSQTFIIRDNPFTTNNGTVNLGFANPTAGYSFGSTAATSITLI